MELTWYGLSCFRITERGQAVVVTDPFNGKVGLPALKLKGDIVTISHDAPGHNNVRAVTGRSHAFVGPGEYEVGGIFITGVATYHAGNDAPNISFTFSYNNMTVAHLGDIAKPPSQTQIEELGQVNILLIPVGGGNSLNATQATELVSMIEPNIVVPMHYAIPNQKLQLDPIDRFLTEMGVSEPTEADSLKVTVTQMSQDNIEVVVLRPKR